MNTQLLVQQGTGLGALLLIYALLDLLFRKNWLNWAAKRLRARQEAIVVPVAVLSGAVLALGYQRSVIGDLPNWYCAGLSFILSYNAATRDFDPTVTERRLWSRWTSVLLSLMCLFAPGLSLGVAIILNCSLRFWLHHATLPMRVLQALVSYQMWVAAWSLLPPEMSLPVSNWIVPTPGLLVAFVLIVIISHYFITALAKALLGPHPLSWVVDNQLHHLPASAYSWGWARFLPWPFWLKIIGLVKAVEIPLQVAAFLFELFIPFALLDAGLAQGFLLAAAAFHLGVFSLAGLLFWDWMAVDLLTFGLIHAGPKTQLSSVFGPQLLLVGLLVMVVFPLRHKLWRPMPLAWFDTPLTARIHWEVLGKSGQWYGLYNDFMCPHERLYGRVHGCFFVPHPVVTYHLGEVWRLEVRDAIVEAGPSVERLLEVRKQYGILPQSKEWKMRHIAYLSAFFARLNAGAKKDALPTWARHLKAPGDQIFYFGNLPSYRRQEGVVKVRIRFIEQYFDGSELVKIHDCVVSTFEVPVEAPPCLPEPTPQELDSFLLELARGRLIVLPGMKKKYAEVLQLAD